MIGLTENELEGKVIQMENMKPEGQSFTPPWSRTQSLPELCSEAGVDFDIFISCLQKNERVEDMARQFGLQAPAIESLQEHFYKYGISSVIGGD